MPSVSRKRRCLTSFPLRLIRRTPSFSIPHSAILFNVKTSREFTRKHENERKLYDVFHLIKSLPETLCCVDENNRVREFESIQEILDVFIDLRLKYYNKRKQYILDTLRNNLEKTNSKYLFVKENKVLNAK